MKKYLWVFFPLVFTHLGYAEEPQQQLPIGSSDQNIDQSSEENSAADTTDDNHDEMVAFLQSLNFRSGNISLGDKIATLNLSDRFRYLSPSDTERLLVEGWGNPPGNETLGMVVPTDVSPLSQEGWGVIIDYSEDGYVSDNDADEIDYDELLDDMKSASAEENEERIKQGYGSMQLIGWAEPPSYDQQTHKMFWAKEFTTDNSDVNSLNYNIRVLGRKGVLVLNAVAGMDQISQIKSEMPDILAATDFIAGNRYEDFDSKTDHVAEYGIAALVAGGIAGKMGLFAKLAALLLAFKKVAIVGVIAIGAFIKSLFSRKKA